MAAPKISPQRVGTDEAVEHGLHHVFERNSVAPQHRILEAALVKGRGQLNLPQLKKNWPVTTNLVRVGSEFSTREILDQRALPDSHGQCRHRGGRPITRHYEPPAHLGHDQRKALAHVLTSPDRVTGFRGLAGSGKSTALVELAQRSTGRASTPFFAPPPLPPPTRSAKTMSWKTMTLQRLLADPTHAQPTLAAVGDGAG